MRPPQRLRSDRLTATASPAALAPAASPVPGGGHGAATAAAARAARPLAGRLGCGRGGNCGGSDGCHGGGGSDGLRGSACAPGAAISTPRPVAGGQGGRGHHHATARERLLLRQAPQRRPCPLRRPRLQRACQWVSGAAAAEPGPVAGRRGRGHCVRNCGGWQLRRLRPRGRGRDVAAAAVDGHTGGRGWGWWRQQSRRRLTG